MQCFTLRLGQAAAVLSGTDGPEATRHALQRARLVADIDMILESCRH